MSHPFSDPHPVAFVTGSAAPRLGRAVAEAFRARGYRVVLHGHRHSELAEELASEWSTVGLPALAVAGDLTDELAIGQMFAHVDNAWGRIDVLVNCAAIWEPRSFAEITAADVRRHFEINTLATFLCAQQAGLRMAKQDSGGAIINLGDALIDSPYLDYAAYFPSKGAIVALTRSLAVELAALQARIRVNAVLPGRAMVPAGLSEVDRAAAIRETLVKLPGRPEHIASAVLFLAEHEYITGVCLPVDGGRGVMSQ